jgi:hypothetical protein
VTVRRRNLSTPPEDDALWAAAQTVADMLGQSLSRLVAKALRDYDPIRVYLTPSPAGLQPADDTRAYTADGELCPSCRQIAPSLREPGHCKDPFHRTGPMPA